MGVASITPAFPKIAETFKLGKAQIGLLISVFTFPGIILSPVSGILADRFGRKIVLIPSLLIFALSGFACFFSKDFTTILILRFFQGVGASALGSLNIALVGDFFKGKDRPAVMGYNASVLSLSTALYPLIGGALAGIAWYYPFILPLLAIPVGLVVVFVMEEPEKSAQQNFFVYLKSAWTHIKRKEVLGLFSISIITFIILYGAFLSYIPFLMDEKFNLSPPQIGIFISLSSFTTAITASFTGKLTNKFGGVNLLKIAFLLYIAVNLLIPQIEKLYLFIIPIMIFGVAQALNIPGIQTLLTNLAPDNQRAIFMSTNGMVLRIGQTLGPPLMALGFALGNIEGVYYLASIIAIVGLLIISTTLNKLSNK